MAGYLVDDAWTKYLAPLSNNEMRPPALCFQVGEGLVQGVLSHWGPRPITGGSAVAIRLLSLHGHGLYAV